MPTTKQTRNSIFDVLRYRGLLQLRFVLTAARMSLMSVLSRYHETRHSVVLPQVLFDAPHH
jgi:hypothetical protein